VNMHDNKSTVVIFTGSYPDTFLEPEIKFFCKSFDRVILVPARRDGRSCTTPKGVEIDESFAFKRDTFWKLGIGCAAFLSSLSYTELLARPVTLIQVRALGFEGKHIPFRSETTSLFPPTSVATTGIPQANASSIETGKPSTSLTLIKASTALCL